MALTREQRLAIIDFLVPLLNDESKRQTHIDLLFAGVPRRPDLDLRGAPRETTTRIVLKLETYSIDPGRPALVDLLEQMSYDVGVDYQARIEAWKTALLTPDTPSAAPPPLEPPNAVSPPVYKAPEQPLVPPTNLPSRAGQFSLPAPFEWITIPAGKVTLEGKNESYLKATTTFDVPAFAIGKYPITKAQYWRFFGSDGYNNKTFWPKNSRRRPDWGSLLGEKDVPVIATWYEAMAFCAWLRITLNEPIHLPTEHQWQRAAQGDDGRMYPWGQSWDAERCNNNIAPYKSSSPTSVQAYAGLGDSPFKVVDLVGNEAEWCVTNWKTGQQGGTGDDARVVRGGSYKNLLHGFLSVVARHKEWPTAECGFRIIRLLE